LKNKIWYPSVSGSLQHQHGEILAAATHKYKYDELKELLCQARSLDLDVLILSGEVAANAIPDSASKMINLFSNFGSIEIIYVVRDWETYLPSRFAQNISRGDSWTWEQYLQYCIKNFRQIIDINYAKVVKCYSGADKIHMIQYCENICKNILDLIGIEGLSGEGVSANVTPSPLDVDVTRLAHTLTHHHLGVSSNMHFLALKERDISDPCSQYRAFSSSLLRNQKLKFELKKLSNEYIKTFSFEGRSDFKPWLDYTVSELSKMGIHALDNGWRQGNSREFAYSNLSINTSKELHNIYKEFVKTMPQSSQ
jgi:hypothetical protein